MVTASSSGTSQSFIKLGAKQKSTSLFRFQFPNCTFQKPKFIRGFFKTWGGGSAHPPSRGRGLGHFWGVHFGQKCFGTSGQKQGKPRLRWGCHSAQPLPPFGGGYRLKCSIMVHQLLKIYGKPAKMDKMDKNGQKQPKAADNAKKN